MDFPWFTFHHISVKYKDWISVSKLNSKILKQEKQFIVSLNMIMENYNAKKAKMSQSIMDIKN